MVVANLHEVSKGFALAATDIAHGVVITPRSGAVALSTTLLRRFTPVGAPYNMLFQQTGYAGVS